MKTSIKIDNEKIDLVLQVTRYDNNHRICIRAIDEKDGAPWGTLTTNIPEEEINPDQMLVKTYSENASWVPQVLAAFPQNFILTQRVIHSGFVQIPVYKFVPPEE